jgi:restriction system protein
MKEKMWMIRAGRGGILAHEFEEKGYVSLGFGRVGDLSNVNSPKDVTEIYKKLNPDQKLGKMRNSAGQLARFRFEPEKGNQVITYSPEFRVYLVGEIISDYGYDESYPEGHCHYRKVKWMGKVNRDDLSTSTKNSIGSIMTFFLINKEAAKEINAALSGKPTVKDLSDDDVGENDSDLESRKKEIQEQSKEYIKDLIQKLDWDDMQELVAGILRTMGYKTRVASPGPDRGVDIVASPDGLGLEQPRIRVEVKHRAGAMGAQNLRSFIGGLTQSDRGLYVSTGGFTREARYEAERSNIPVTLIDIDELADLLISNYDNADTETRALVPLIKLYWPA